MELWAGDRKTIWGKVSLAPFQAVCCSCGDRTSSLDHFHNRKTPSNSRLPAPLMVRVTSCIPTTQSHSWRCLGHFLTAAAAAAGKTAGCQVGDCDTLWGHGTTRWPAPSCESAAAPLTAVAAAAHAPAVLHPLLLGGFFDAGLQTELPLCRQMFELQADIKPK